MIHKLLHPSSHTHPLTPIDYILSAVFMCTHIIIFHGHSFIHTYSKSYLNSFACTRHSHSHSHTHSLTRLLLCVSYHFHTRRHWSFKALNKPVYSNTVSPTPLHCRPSILSLNHTQPLSHSLLLTFTCSLLLLLKHILTESRSLLITPVSPNLSHLQT